MGGHRAETARRTSYPTAGVVFTSRVLNETMAFTGTASCCGGSMVRVAGATERHKGSSFRMP
eukprot:5742634-Alexandrium_andersonii.AAC.1